MIKPCFTAMVKDSHGAKIGSAFRSTFPNIYLVSRIMKLLMILTCVPMHPYAFMFTLYFIVNKSCCLFYLIFKYHSAVFYFPACITMYDETRKHF